MIRLHGRATPSAKVIHCQSRARRYKNTNALIVAPLLNRSRCASAVAFIFKSLRIEDGLSSNGQFRIIYRNCRFAVDLPRVTRGILRNASYRTFSLSLIFVNNITIANSKMRNEEKLKHRAIEHREMKRYETRSQNFLRKQC